MSRPVKGLLRSYADADIEKMQRETIAVALANVEYAILASGLWRGSSADLVNVIREALK